MPANNSASYKIIRQHIGLKLSSQTHQIYCGENSVNVSKYFNYTGIKLTTNYVMTKQSISN